MSKRIDLLGIDPQVDFCAKNGALSVPGADEDMERVVSMIERMGERFEDIHITLDSHHLFHIANPPFWMSSGGKHPDPFTLISAEMVERGEWIPTIPHLRKRALEYVRTLESNGRYVLCIWPPHCLIGSTGHALVPTLFEALVSWERKNIAVVDKVTKGSNLYTEHYSAVKADVVDSSDPTTQLNTKLIQTLEEADEIVIFGEAISHCLKFTVEDIADGFSDERYIQKMVLLTDAASAVPGFEAQGEEFVRQMVARGMRTSTTREYMA